MFVPLKNSNATLIGVLLLSVLAVYTVFQSHRALEAAEDNYFSLLQKQTVKFAEAQSELQRVRFLGENKDLFEAFDRQSNDSQIQSVVLEHLETWVLKRRLLEVSYEFLESRPLMDVTSNLQIIYDSVRLKGGIKHMVDFNQAMEGLNAGAPVLFELHRCDIRRTVDSASALIFDCLLRWYSLQ